MTTLYNATCEDKEFADVVPDTGSPSPVRCFTTPTSPAQDGGVYHMKRGLSKAFINYPLVSRAREVVQHDVDSSDDGNSESEHIIATSIYTFVLPNLNLYPDGYKAFLYKELIEMSSLVSLEQAGYLNWWVDLLLGPRLYPMQTSGDGNCLLHAASLAMWGFHDRQLVLRKLLASSMTGKLAAAFQRRWRWQQMKCNKQCGLVLTDDEWNNEWQHLVKLANWQPKNRCTSTPIASSRSSAGKLLNDESVYESLEELHVFVLAHVLRRPIVVIAKTMLTDVHGDALAPIPFGGIYLPLDCRQADCHRCPLLLTYDNAHFSALVWMDNETSKLMMPLVNPKLELLQVHFSTDPGPGVDWQHQYIAAFDEDFEVALATQTRLVQRYMDVKLTGIATTNTIKQSEAFGRLLQRRGSLDSTPVAGDVKSCVITRQTDGVIKTFGSLGQSVSKKLKHIASPGFRSNKVSFGSATQSSRANLSAVKIITNHTQVLCAMLRQQQMFHRDDLVCNYLSHAVRRYENLRAAQRRQSNELQRLMSPVAQSHLDPSKKTLHTLPAFERKNTLLLTGKSKFYTMSYEVHCHHQSEAQDNETSSVAACRRVQLDGANLAAADSALTDAHRKPGISKSQTFPVRGLTSVEDKNQNIFWLSGGTELCKGASDCHNPIIADTGGLCASCYQAKRYSYPTATTKL